VKDRLGELAGWRSKDAISFPPADDKYMEDETCKAWGVKPWEFRKLSASERAELLAHEYIKAVREGAYSERRSEKKPNTDKGENMISSFERRFKPR
jgi:hypothetical protein